MVGKHWPLRRPFWVWLHRWVGLALALVLVVVGLTGSLLAFYPELQRLANPHWYPDRPPATWLSPGELASRLEAAEPRAKVGAVQMQAFDGVARAWVEARVDPATGKPFEIGHEYAILDPATGAVLDRARWAGIGDSWRQIVDFIYELHFELALGTFGAWLLGILALAWTIDCFVGAYLTLPARRSAGRGFWARWQPAWKLKRGGGNYRLNFDLHRAGGLWLWVALLVFAWSSVYMNLSHNVYTWVTRAVMDYWPRWVLLVPKPEPVATPSLGWREAQVVAGRLMAGQAQARGIEIGPPVSLRYDPGHGSYTYEVQSSLDITDRPRRYGVSVVFDGHGGALQHVLLPSGQHTGNTVTHWLHALHMGNVFGLPYRIFVCLLGIAIAVLSITGVVVWWHKRRARQSRRLRPAGGRTGHEPAPPDGAGSGLRQQQFP